MVPAIFETEIVLETNGRYALIIFVHATCVTAVVTAGCHLSLSLVVRIILIHRCPVFIKWTDGAHVWIHVVCDVLFVLLPLIFELPSHFFPEYLHVFMDALLDLLLNKTSNSLPHVDWYLLKL